MGNPAKRFKTISVKSQSIWCGINEQKGIYKSESLEYLRSRQLQIPISFRDPRIEKALTVVEAAPPSRKHFVEFLVTLNRMGFHGCEVAQEILCNTIARTTHAHRFGIRTLRDSAKWAAQNGFIAISWVPIGDKYQTAEGEWKTKRIRRYTLTDKVRLLTYLLRVDLKKYRPLLISVASQPQEPTPAKSADNPNGELPGDSYKSPGKLKRHCQINETSCEDSQPTAEESPSGDKSTRPSNTSRSRTVEQQRSQTPATRSRRPQKKAVPFHSRQFSRAPVVFQAARKRFLHELWIALKPGTTGSLPHAEQLYRIAEFQTDPTFPEIISGALNWFDRILSIYPAPWHERRKILTREIIPALEIYWAQWQPPKQIVSDEEYCEIYEDWELTLCPEPGIAVRPANLREYYRIWPFVRSMISALIDGKTTWSAVFSVEKNALIELSRLLH